RRRSTHPTPPAGKIRTLREQDVEHGAAGVVGYLDRPTAPIDLVEQHRRLMDQQHGMAMGRGEIAQFPAFDVAHEPPPRPEMKEQTVHSRPRFLRPPWRPTRVRAIGS